MTNYEIVKRWRKTHKAEVNAQARRYRAKYPDKIRAIRTRYKINHFEEIRKKDMLMQRNYRKTEKYRLAQQIRNKRFKEKLKQERLKNSTPQTEFCEICRKITTTVWDHDHKTGLFRGWLCHRCNRTLGQVQDNSNLLNQMIIYLNR